MTNDGAQVINQVLSQVSHPLPGILIALYAIADGQTLPCATQELVEDMAMPIAAEAEPPLTARQAMFAGVFGKSSSHRTHSIMTDFARGASGLFSDLGVRDLVQQRAYGDVLLTRLQRSPEADLFTTYAPHLLRDHGPEEGLRAGYFTLSRSNMWPKSVVVDTRNCGRPGGPQVQPPRMPLPCLCCRPRQIPCPLHVQMATVMQILASPCRCWQPRQTLEHFHNCTDCYNAAD